MHGTDEEQLRDAAAVSRAPAEGGAADPRDPHPSAPPALLRFVALGLAGWALIGLLAWWLWPR